jgi:ATP-binding cassette subfamily F protein uup
MATVLQVDNLARSYGEKNLFEKISFVISQYQKVALIARNGAGKTSLLNIIAGLEQSDGGSYQVFPPFTMQYLLQEPKVTDSNTVFEEVYLASNEIQKTILNYEHVIKGGDKKAIEEAMAEMDTIKGWDYEVRIRQILTQLKLPDLDKSIRELSGGQQKRVALAKILITEPDFIILDEPTNHLDVEMIEWLEEYLSQRSLTILMVTHDRYFLDRVCDEIIEMENSCIYRYKGNYSYFLEKQAERQDMQTKETEKARNLLRRESDWMSRMPKARTTKSKARIDSFYDLEEKASNFIREDKLKISIEGTRMGKKILEVNDISFKWGDTDILKGFTHTFKRFEKIGIIGKNGSGKSTFLNLITGALRPQKGSIQKGETINFGYYRQEGISFNPDTKVIDVVKEIAEEVKLGNGDTISAGAFLNYFMFPYPSHHQPVYRLSGGEKRRLYLVTVLMRSPNFLILDEPTNDLDILTLNVLEEYLAAFNGCVLVVTHDRFFLDKVIDHLFVFEGEGIIKDFPGNYTIFKDHDDKRKKAEQSKLRAQIPKKEKPRQVSQNKLSWKEQRELEQLEKEIESLEKEKSEIEKAMNSGDLPHDKLMVLSDRYQIVLKELSSKSDRWLELSEMAK